MFTRLEAMLHSYQTYLYFYFWKDFLKIIWKRKESFESLSSSWHDISHSLSSKTFSLRVFLSQSFLTLALWFRITVYDRRKGQGTIQVWGIPFMPSNCLSTDKGHAHELHVFFIFVFGFKPSVLLRVSWHFPHLGILLLNLISFSFSDHAWYPDSNLVRKSVRWPLISSSLSLCYLTGDNVYDKVQEHIYMCT